MLFCVVTRCHSTLVWLCIFSLCFSCSGVLYCHFMSFNTCLALFIHSVFKEVLFSVVTPCHSTRLPLLVHSVFDEVVFDIVIQCYSTLVWLWLFILFLMKWCFVLSLHVIQHLSGFVYLFFLWWSYVFYCHSMSLNTCLACLFILVVMKCCFVLSFHIIQNLSGFIYSFYFDEVVFCIVTPCHWTRVWLYLFVLFLMKVFCIVTPYHWTLVWIGLGGSFGCAVQLETRTSRVQPPPRSTFFRGDW